MEDPCTAVMQMTDRGGASVALDKVNAKLKEMRFD